MEEITKDLTDSEKLNLILAELADMKIWRTKVDAFIEDRSRDTQPMLGKIHKEIADTRYEMREKFEQVDKRFEEMEEKQEVTTRYAKDAYRWVRMQNEELVRARLDVEELRDHVHDLERQQPKAA